MLGIPAEQGPIKIEGGPPSIKAWKKTQAARRRQAPQSPPLLSSAEPLLLWANGLMQNHEPPTKKLQPG